MSPRSRAHRTRAQAHKFYAEHKGRPFYDTLGAFMTSAPIVVQVLEGKNAIAKYRTAKLRATRLGGGEKGDDPQAFCAI